MIARACLLLLCMSLGACALVSKSPTLAETGGQHSTAAHVSTTSPLIVEWPAAERGRLEALMQKGAVAVRYSGAKLDVLPGCTSHSEYRFAQTAPKSEHLVFSSAAELDASFPLGAARLGAGLKRGAQLELTTRLIGRWELTEAPRIRERQGEKLACRSATHWIVAATVGAFRFYSNAESHHATKLGAAYAGQGLSGEVGERRAVLNADGSPEQCAQTEAKGPPRSCSALIRLELTPYESPRIETLADLGTLDFVPIERRSMEGAFGDAFEFAPFPFELCQSVGAGLMKGRQKEREAGRRLLTLCTPTTVSPSLSVIREQKDLLLALPSPAAVSEGRIYLLALHLQERMKNHEPAASGSTLVSVNDGSEAANGSSPSLEMSAIAELETIADEHPIQHPLGYFARYVLAGSMDREVEERSLRELLSHPGLAQEIWPRMRLSRIMLDRDDKQAAALALSARALASRCGDERASVLSWLVHHSKRLLSEGESFEIHLDSLQTMAAQGRLGTEVVLGDAPSFEHDFETWISAEKGLRDQPWALGALLWSQGVQCYFRGNESCARQRFLRIVQEARSSPYVLPAYQAALRLTQTETPSRLAHLAKLHPDVTPGSSLRQQIAEAPSCGVIGEGELQKVLDKAQRLSVEWIHGERIRRPWEVDSLSGVAPPLSACALKHPSNGQQRLLRLKLRFNKPDAVTANTVQARSEGDMVISVASLDKSSETQDLATCVQQRLRGNARVFSTGFQMTVRLAPEVKTSFDYNQGWPEHVRARFECSGGDENACLRLGHAWLSGVELPREPEQALSIFQAKCKQGFLPACLEEGKLRVARRDHQGDRGKGRVLLLKACMGGEGEACRLLADAEPKLQAASKRDLLRYHELMHAACYAQKADPTACVQLWYHHQEGVLPKAKAEYLQELLHTACTILGDGTMAGSCETPEEMVFAYPHRAHGELARLTCRHGVAQSCLFALDEASAEERESFAQKGCTAGSADACYFLSEYRRRGATKKDEEKALNLLSRAISLCSKLPPRDEEDARTSVCDDEDALLRRHEILKWQLQGGSKERPKTAPQATPQTRP